MKIIKLVKNGHDNYYAMFDKEFPVLTYEKIGSDYVGSVKDDNGNVILSNVLKWESWPGAFGGREITLKMKDGTDQVIKDYWYDCGYDSNEGEFISIGAGTLEELQKCFVYYSLNIKLSTFEEMVNEYLSRDKLYDYKEVEEWAKIQYKWYPLVVHGKVRPFMMNKFGMVVTAETKERVYTERFNRRRKDGKLYNYFKMSYNDGTRLVKLEDTYINVCLETLTTYCRDEIITNCKLDPETNKAPLTKEQQDEIKPIKSDIKLLKDLLKRHDAEDLISLTFLEDQLQKRVEEFLK